MRFVLDLWPDLDEDATAEDLLRFAYEVMGATNDALVWDILDDEDRLIHRNVMLWKPEGDQA